MQTWEYTTFESDGEVVTAIEGLKMSEKNLSEQHHLQDLGTRNWELVAVTLANAGFYKFFLKRPKQSDTGFLTEQVHI
jgi:hypothetical protein